MGYRSQIAVVIKTADNDKFAEAINDWDKKYNLDEHHGAKYLLKYADMDEATARKAVEYYRERYSTTGIFENRPYPGVEKMLQELRRKKYLLAVASSKPEYYVKQILDYFNLTEYFDEIVGSEMNGARTNKTEVIEETLKRLGLDHHREQVIMVGDKEHDVLGARKAGLDCVAVSYGYGTEEELVASQPLQIVASAEEILDFFA